MMIQVNVPSVATVVVRGDVGCGKSAVMGRLMRVLQEEFGATVVLSEALRNEQRGGNLDRPQDWERDVVKNTVWVLHEA